MCIDLNSIPVNCSAREPDTGGVSVMPKSRRPRTTEEFLERHEKFRRDGIPREVIEEAMIEARVQRSAMLYALVTGSLQWIVRVLRYGKARLHL